MHWLQRAGLIADTQEMKTEFLLPLTNMLVHTASAHMYNNSANWARHIFSNSVMRYNVFLYCCRSAAKLWISRLLWRAVHKVFDLSQIVPPSRSLPDSLNCFPEKTIELLLHSTQASLNVTRFFLTLTLSFTSPCRAETPPWRWEPCSHLNSLIWVWR